MLSLPSEFLESLALVPGFDRDAFVASHQQDQQKLTSIRLNPFKPVDLDFELGSPIPWLKNGYYLAERPSFTLDPLFHAGAYYVQEAGSMFLDFALRSALDLQKPLKILDVCAAPGGKSTLLNSLLKPEDLLVSNEIIKSRSLILSDQMGKWGSANSIVINNDPPKLKEITSLFDVIVVDAPCSGSGLFRKQPEAIAEWSLEAVAACSTRQKNILESLVPEMKAGAYLFYSTCSFSRQENEEIVTWLIENYDLNYVTVPINSSWGIVDTGLGYRFYPNKTNSEGFFCALLQKQDTDAEENRPKLGKNNLLTLNKEELKICESILGKFSNDLIKKNDFIYYMPQQVRDFVSQFEKQVYFRKAGVCVGEIKGRDLVPDHELALANLDSLNIHHETLDKSEALQYLRKEAMPSKKGVPGFSLMTYKGLGIGWAKLLPNRINNYLPNQARVLMKD